MGFFNWVAEKATSAIGSVVSTIGSAVTEVGKITHNDKIENAGRAIKAFGDNLAGDIGKTGSYDSTSGDVRQTEDLSVTLARYSKNIERSADETQNEIEEVVKAFFEELSQMADKNGISLPKNTIRKERQDALKAQEGFLKRHIAKRLSLDDRECLNILKMDKGYDKERQMRNFADKVMREGKQGLCARVKDIILSLFDSFGDAFDNMIADQNLLLQNAEQSLSSLQDDTPSRERAQASANAIVDGVCLIGHLLSEVDRGI